MYKIMLADDEGIVIDSLKFIIQKEFGDDCEVEFAKTGRNVIELAETFRPDIAVMDIQMPGIDGYEAARSIRRLYDREHAEIPIIAMTANAFDEDMERARSAGMDGYIAKPVDPESIKKILGRILPAE